MIKRYEKFIESRRHRLLPEGALVERHHIVPRCCGGLDDDNKGRESPNKYHLDLDYIRDSYLGGSSCPTIAKELGVSADAVADRVKKMGIMRHGSQAQTSKKKEKLSIGK